MAALSHGLARLPRDVPELPKGYIVREALLHGLKKKLLEPTPTIDSQSSQSLQSADSVLSGIKILTAHGMGGSGKTVIASALCNDIEVRQFFRKVAFIALGQNPVMAELQKSLYRQLTGRPLDPTSSDDARPSLVVETAVMAWGEARRRRPKRTTLGDRW